MAEGITKVKQYHPPAILESIYSPVPAIFLAGPIQGAPDWQSTAAGIIGYVSQEKPLSVYNPRAVEPMQHSKEEQIRWEKMHLARARDLGAVLFWFAAQDDSLDYPSARCYAQTTRIEFGRAMGWLDYRDPQPNLALGIDSKYQGVSEDYLRDCAREYSLPVYSDFELLCRHAIKLALS